uniref:Uncharacterized protein n=1 Tax=Arion vulgaris TaxID=1028688 RepID=A0A0B7C0U8_9EUPU
MQGKSPSTQRVDLRDCRDNREHYFWGAHRDPFQKSVLTLTLCGNTGLENRKKEKTTNKNLRIYATYNKMESNNKYNILQIKI